MNEMSDIITQYSIGKVLKIETIDEGNSSSTY